MINSKKIDRREFVRTSLRFGIGCGLVVTGIMLGTRKKSASYESDLCQISSPCMACSGLLSGSFSITSSVTIPQTKDMYSGLPACSSL